jgi:hypothetical protein
VTKSVFTLFILFFAPITKTMCQDSDILWSKSYGGSEAEIITALIATADGGYIAGGLTYSTDGDITNSQGEGDVWIVKFDDAGNLQWQKTYGGSQGDEVYSIVQTKDNGFLFTGYTVSDDGDISGYHGGPADGWVVKIDSTGLIQWQRCYGGTSSDFLQSIIITDDNNYVFLGSTSSTDEDLSNNIIQGQVDVWLLTTDSLGNIISSYTYGSSDYDHGISICKGLSVGGYALLCVTYGDDGDVSNSNHHGNGTDYWIVIVDSNGQIHHSRCYGGFNLDVGYNIINTSDGNYLATGFSWSSDGDVIGHHGNPNQFLCDVWIIKVDSAANLLWAKDYGGSMNDGSYSVVESGSNYFIAGYAASTDGDVVNIHGFSQADAWLLKLNSSGDLLWQKCYGGTESEVAHAIVESPDGGLTCAGFAESADGDLLSNNGDYDFWIFKLAGITAVSEVAAESGLQVFPNPASENIHFTNDQNKEATVVLLNLLGQPFYKTHVNPNEEIDINVSSFPTGLYVLKVDYGEQTEQQKIVLK